MGWKQEVLSWVYDKLWVVTKAFNDWREKCERIGDSTCVKERKQKAFLLWLQIPRHGIVVEEMEYNLERNKHRITMKRHENEKIVQKNEGCRQYNS